METPPVDSKKTLSSSLSKSSLTPCRRLGLCRPSSGSLKKSLHLRTLNSVPNESTVKKKLEDVLISSDKSPSLDGEDRPHTPLKSNDNLSKKANAKIRRCLSIGSKAPLSKAKVLSSSNEDSNKCDNSNSCKYDFKKNMNIPNVYTCDNSKRFKVDDSVNSYEENEGNNQSERSVISCNSTKTIENSLVNAEVEETKEISCEMFQKLIYSIREKKKKLDLLKVQETYAKKHNLEDLRAQTIKWRTAGQEALRYSLSLARNAGYPVMLGDLMTQHGFPPHLMGYSAEDDEFS
uniref:Swi5-dependent recombination DNA repair protein 1 homolog n=1 Tax=Cuerna arida TaxID=1464854 RepID=A0A1B6GPA6_9HEMI